MTLSFEITIGPCVIGAGVTVGRSCELQWRFWLCEVRLWAHRGGWGVRTEFWNPRKSTHECASDCCVTAFEWASWGIPKPDKMWSYEYDWATPDEASTLRLSSDDVQQNSAEDGEIHSEK